MTLDILVTHYKEPWSVIKPLLQSIAIQGGIEFKNLQVIIGHDGKGMEFDPKLFEEFPFHIKQYSFEHGGVSACRNALLDKSKADYISFSDCDDMYLSGYGLYLVFNAMEKRFDAITSLFIEEHKCEDGTYKIVQRDKDTTFVHGKFYRREYLLKNKIRFKPELTIHEDGYFNCLAALCTDNRYYITTPIYIWKWRDGSAAQKDNENFVLETYGHMIKTRTYLTREARDRGYEDEFYTFVCKTIIDSYYDFNKPNYLKPENKEKAEAAEKAFREYYMEFRKDYNDCNIRRIADIMQACRDKAYKGGLRVEQRTISDWLEHIVRDYK